MTIPEELETLLNKRLRLVDEIAELHAKYGPSGTYIARRDILAAQLSRKHRSILGAADERITQSHLDEQVKIDPEYMAFITDVEACREKLFQLYGLLKDTTMRIQWITRTGGAAELEGYESEQSEDVK